MLVERCLVAEHATQCQRLQPGILREQRRKPHRRPCLGRFAAKDRSQGGEPLPAYREDFWGTVQRGRMMHLGGDDCQFIAGERAGLVGGDERATAESFDGR